MCGIFGAINLRNEPIEKLEKKLSVMNTLLAHRGPDGNDTWRGENDRVGLGHRRLAILELSEAGAQPMHAPNRTHITFNGEIYNYPELQKSEGSRWNFAGGSDTETILAAYDHYGEDASNHLRGMFSYAIWDERKQSLHCSRDRFGIKPFYYTQVGSVLYFASEIKALLPVLPAVEMDRKGFSEYLTFQYPVSELTLFKGVMQLMPGHSLTVKNGSVSIKKYWDVKYQPDHSYTLEGCQQHLRELIADSTNVHLRADVPIGSYLSGGIDSSLIAMLASDFSPENNLSFHGKFTCYPGYDESHYAEIVAKKCNNNMHQIDISASDFSDNMSKIIYHLDTPVAGPGSFPQYMVSKLASEHLKVVLGGQGGDEIFGGYARYLVGYTEQLLKGAIEGRLNDGAFSVSFESVIPNLPLLQEYKPLMQKLFEKDLFGEIDMRFYRLIDRSSDLSNEVNSDAIDMEHVVGAYKKAYNDTDSVAPDAYLDSMSRFDFKKLLPGLLQVEDRMSMAHGLESRVPLLDHAVVEYAATIPPEIKYSGGRLKELLRSTYTDVLPTELTERRDKMGFPVPLKEWYADELRDYIQDTFRSKAATERAFMNSEKVLQNFDKDSQFSRKTWGLLSLELWNQNFYDRAHEFRAMLN